MHTLPFEIDCTHCGCADVEVERAPKPEAWFGDGIGRCNHCRQTFSFHAPEEADEKDSGSERETIVIYAPQCPYCGSTDVPAQNSKHPDSLPARVQSRKCRQCQRSFKCIVKTKEIR